MKYLKKFESSQNLLVDEHTTRCIKEVEDIFTNFIDEHYFEKFDWSEMGTDHLFWPLGYYYAFVTPESIQNDEQWRRQIYFLTQRLGQNSVDIAQEMLKEKYFGICIIENLEGPLTNMNRKSDQLLAIQNEFIPRIESIGYKITMEIKIVHSVNKISNRIILKINYTEV